MSHGVSGTEFQRSLGVTYNRRDAPRFLLDDKIA
ncbi:hypothetical protein MPC4_20022 [Methylocella tundrae]|uniref:Uncharacterized protein n=1 Tax=Methylocella tundrae TaxID=227605 RepID=A0A8B6M6V9_METTU|nr:hypothetical protein MPC4_20022 [Methylocella tundrae]